MAERGLAVDPLDPEPRQLPGANRRDDDGEDFGEAVLVEAGEAEQALAATFEVERRLAVAEDDIGAGDAARSPPAAAVAVGIFVLAGGQPRPERLAP